MSPTAPGLAMSGTNPLSRVLVNADDTGNNTDAPVVVYLEDLVLWEPNKEEADWIKEMEVDENGWHIDDDELVLIDTADRPVNLSNLDHGFEEYISEAGGSNPKSDYDESVGKHSDGTLASGENKNHPRMQRRDERDPDIQHPKFESGALWSQRKERKASLKGDCYELGIQKLRVKSRAYRGEWDEQHNLHEERIGSKDDFLGENLMEPDVWEVHHHEQSGLGRPFGNLDSQGIEECSDDAEFIVFKHNNAAPTSLPDQKRFQENRQEHE